MQRQFRIKSYNLLTLKCWLLVCLFLSISSAIFAQSDTANASKADIDSLSVDSLQMASDFKSKVVYNAFDSLDALQ